MADKKILLEARDLVKEFALEGGKKGKNVVHAVSGVNLKIYEGETLALVGESACGKSTLPDPDQAFGCHVRHHRI